MPCRWVEYKDKKILYQDYRGLSKEEMLSTAEEAFKMTSEYNGNLIILIDIREAFLSEEFMNKVKEIGSKSKDKIQKTAIIGIQGIKKIIFNAFNAFIGTNNFKAFETEDAAKEYLTS